MDYWILTQQRHLDKAQEQQCQSLALARLLRCGGSRYGRDVDVGELLFDSKHPRDIVGEMATVKRCWEKLLSRYAPSPAPHGPGLGCKCGLWCRLPFPPA